MRLKQALFLYLVVLKACLVLVIIYYQKSVKSESEYYMEDVVFPDDFTRNYGNVPVFYQNNEEESVPVGVNQTCATFPKFERLQYNEHIWQVLKTTTNTYYLLNAYLDNRVYEDKFVIRILGLLGQASPAADITYCQIWFEGKSTPIIVQANHTWMWENFPDKENVDFQPYLFNCELPNGEIPASVSLATSYCEDSTTNLRILYEKRRSSDTFGICVKNLDITHTYTSVRLLEWIETMSALGVKKMHFNNLNIGHEHRNILQYYTKLDMVEINDVIIPPSIINLDDIFIHKNTKRKLFDFILDNDCFYKNMYRYEWMAFLDTDEVIMPLGHYDWFELLEWVKMASHDDVYLEDYTHSYLTFKQKYFQDSFLEDKDYNKEIPRELHMLQHIYRNKYDVISEYDSKALFNTSEVVVLDSYRALKCIAKCEYLIVKDSVAQFNHYKTECPNFKCTFSKFILEKDDEMLKFKDVVLFNAQIAIDEM